MNENKQISPILFVAKIIAYTKILNPNIDKKNNSLECLYFDLKGGDIYNQYNFDIAYITRDRFL
jgi:hypothetical protein